ncbi:Riboflavin kinase [Gimesia algae]|uniref:Riboflavin biosynthesis protein n=2 Tax=Gimesia algae TaxID=2527971 RepID=A0A517V8W7_9PLAN|nr:Riboflavin kinase [Gimesia algae]
MVSIGNFDGVHRGHQLMILTLVLHARTQKIPAIVFTFDPHPIHLLRPEHAPPELMTIEQRAEVLQGLGVDCVIAYPTDRALLNLTAEEFFQQVLCDQLQAKGMVEGPNFYFGKNRAGDVTLLGQLCDQAGMFFKVVEPTVCGSRMISSSEVRKSIQEGDIGEATRMLGRLYQITGTVGHGAERGRMLGFPTANLTEIKTLIPADGVYCGVGEIAGKQYPAAIHIGGNPTFQQDETKVEVHLIGFSEDIYGQILQVQFLDRLRGTQTFADTDALKSQLLIDVESAKKLASQWIDLQ